MRVVRWAISLGLAATVLVLSCLSFTSFNTVNAQNIGGITISPSLKELVLGPGLLEAKTTIELRNNTNQDLVATIRLVDFDALGEFGGVSFSQIDAPLTQYSLAKWMNLPGGSTVKLRKNQNTIVPVTIRNDAELTPGGHYGAAIVSVSADKPSQSSQLSFNQELASLLFVKKTGGEAYGIQLESIKPENLPNIPQTINLKFKGTGNVHVVPRGYIEVRDPKDNLIAKGIINPESTLVMPNKSRQFTTIMQPVAEAKSKGEYKINVFYRYDDIEEFQLQTLTFNRGISFLSTGIILLVLVLLTGVVAIILRKRRLKKSRNSRYFE